MGLFSKSQEKAQPMLSFHIGSGMVGGAMFLPKASGTPQIIFKVSEPIAIDQEFNPERLLEQTVKTLGKVAQKLHDYGAGAPERIFCTLASPWYASQTRTIYLRKNTPFLFTEKIADELIQKEIKLMGEEHAAQYGSGENATRAIELKNIRTALNGYETAEPLYQKTKELEMTLFISMGGESVLRKMEDAVRRFFQFQEIKFSSFAMASFTVARDLDHKRENFLLVDIGGEVTEVFMVKKNVLRDSISFPLGRNFFERSVASALGSTLPEADSLISLWKDGHAEEAVAQKLNALMDKLRAEWLKKFQEALAHLSNDISIPAAVYVTADQRLAQMFADTIKAEQFSQYTLAESKFEITLLDAGFLKSLSLLSGETDRDPFLAIDCIYINRFLVKI